MNCLTPSRKNLDTDRYSKSSPNLHDTLIAELQLRLKPPEVKSCENLTATDAPKVKSLIGKSHSFRLEKPTRKVKKSDSFFMLSSPKGNATIYGSNLMANEKDPIFRNVPRFLVECCKRIDKKLEETDEVQGVYRVPGEFAKIHKIGRKVVKGDYEFLDSVECINDLTGSVKLFLRETKSPLISSEEIQCSEGLNRERWYDASKEDKIKALQKFVTNIEVVRKDTLEYILTHLKRLCSTYPEKLNSKNFAISIGPAIIHINNKACLSVVDTLTEHDILNEYLQFMIDNCFEIYRRNSIVSDEYGEEMILETSL